MKQLLQECTGFKGIIIDVRDNKGGLPKVGDRFFVHEIFNITSILKAVNKKLKFDRAGGWQ